MLASQIITLLLRVRRRLTRNVALAIGFSSVAAVLIGGTLVYLAERYVNPSLATVADAVWWAVVTVTTVGYGDRTPITLAGRAVGVVLMVVGIGFLGVFTASVASYFIDRLLRGGKGLMPANAANHILICGWSEKGRLVIHELRSETNRPIVILADLPEQPIEGDGLVFVHGKPYLEESLRKAGVDRASVAVVLADESEGPPSDARSVLTVLAVESINRAIHTCVEILDRQNIEHLRRAGADEILPTNQLVGCLLARASLHPGVIDVVGDLAASGDGAEVYVVPVDPSLVGITFDDALRTVRSRDRAILIGLREGERSILCPTGTVALREGQQLIMVSLEKPRWSERTSSSPAH